MFHQAGNGAGNGTVPKTGERSDIRQPTTRKRHTVQYNNTLDPITCEKDDGMTFELQWQEKRN